MKITERNVFFLIKDKTKYFVVPYSYFKTNYTITIFKSFYIKSVKYSKITGKTGLLIFCIDLITVLYFVVFPHLNLGFPKIMTLFASVVP